ncbi:MAG: helix-turn-helix transcriptional regulator, partial [Clostridia bacterium]|nr:helix-turn-helix transcriptional regulator [Clostridia bacterium]
MEFNEKLQELRKQKGLTQEELAQKLYVSRTAISKWESGRGYPSIDSLKSIARFFSITVDELLSSDEILIVAEENQKQTEKRFRDLLFGLLDLCMLLLLFLPLFAISDGSIIREASLLSLSGVSMYLKIAYFAVVIAMCITGILTLAMQSCSASVWIKSKLKISVALGIISVLLFIISKQPYAA